MLRVTLTILLLTACGSTLAQDASPWRATELPTISFSDVVVAQVAPGEDEQLEMVVTLQAYRPEPQRRTVVVTRLVPETRTRTVTVDGQAKTQQYTVYVPVQETREETVTVMVPNKTTRKNAPLGSVQAWELEGRRLTGAELAKRLAKPEHVFLSPAPYSQHRKIGAYHARVLRPKVLFIHVLNSGAPLPDAPAK